MRVLAFMKYGSKAASARQRLMQFSPYLAGHGIDIAYRPLLDNDHVRRIAEGKPPAVLTTLRAYARRTAELMLRRDYDVLWLQYELFPYLPGLFERLAKVSRKPLVIDYDDAIFHMYDAHLLAPVRGLLGQKLVPLLKRADAVVCGNAYIEAYARRFCPRTTIIPTVVDTEVFRPAPEPRPDRPLTIGWIGSPGTWLSVERILPAILSLLARHGAVMRVVGAGPRARGIAGIEAVEWVEEREVADVQAMDIGIMPVDDSAWSRGKCGYKLIQYMACGLPVVASPVGVNGGIVIAGESGLLARTDEDWVDAIGRLISDPRLRSQMGAKGRTRAEAHYSLASQQPRLLELLRSMA